MKKNQKVGKIYFRIAEKCFDVERPDVPVETTEAVLNRGDLHEIEKYVKVARILSAAVHEFGRLASVCGVYVTPKLFWDAVYAEDPDVSMIDFVLRLKERQFSSDWKSIIVLEMLAAAHKEWMDVHQDEFFDEKKVKQRCVFMPFELVGVERALFYRIYIEDMLEVLGWSIDAKCIKRYYNLKQLDFINECNLGVKRYGKEALVDFLMKTDLVPPKIAKVLHSNRAIAEQMAHS